MKISHWFVLLLFAFLIVVLMIILGDPIEAATGSVHERFETMKHSENSVVSNSKVKWLAYFFGMGIICIFGFTITFGAKRKGAWKGIKPWLFISIIAYLIVFSLLTFKYWQYSENPAGQFFGGLPTVTALALYGLGFIPIILSIIYVLKFKEWILTEEDEQQFQKIIQKRNQST